MSSRRAHAWIIYYACCLHGLWAALLLGSADPAFATPLSAIVSATGGRWSASFWLIAVAILAAFGASAVGRIRAILLGPQQAVLVVGAIGATSRVLAGSYADGTMRPHLFILADQAPAILLAGFHTAGLFVWRRA